MFTHRKYFCGESAQRTEAQAKTQRKGMAPCELSMVVCAVVLRVAVVVGADVAHRVDVLVLVRKIRHAFDPQICSKDVWNVATVSRHG